MPRRPGARRSGPVRSGWVGESGGRPGTRKTTANLQGLTAQGIDAVVLFGDGPAMLPTIRQAFKNNVSIVPYTASPGGRPGKDYVDFVGPNSPADGTTWAEWVAGQIGHKGKVAFLGGIPGNLQSLAELDTIRKVFAKYPGMQLINDTVIDTHWDPAETQRVTAGLLTQNPQVDAIIADYGGGAVGGVRAFLSAKRPLVPWATIDDNEFACLWQDNKAQNSGFKIMTTTSRTWLVRVALRKAVAHAEGLQDDEPSIVNMPVVEDSTKPDLQPKCSRDLPPDAILSTKLPPEKLKAALK